MTRASNRRPSVSSARIWSTPILLRPERRAPEQDARKYARLYFERRRAKGITEMEAAEIARNPLYTAALMVAAGDADGFVGGAVNTTAETVRAALHCIGTGAFGPNGFERLYRGSSRIARSGTTACSRSPIVPSSSIRRQWSWPKLRSRLPPPRATLSHAEPIVALLSFSTKGSTQPSVGG